MRAVVLSRWLAVVLLPVVCFGEEVPIALPLRMEALRRLPEQASGAEEVRGLVARLRDAGSRARAAGDTLSEAYARAGLAAIEERLGRWRRAEDGVREAASGADPLLDAQVSLWLAGESMALSRPQRVRYWAQRAAGEYRDAGERSGLARAMQAEAQVTLPLTRRRQFLEEALSLAREGGNALDVAAIQTDLGEALRATGDMAGAIANLQSSSAALEKIGDRQQTARALTLLARSYAAHGKAGQGLALLNRASGLLQAEPPDSRDAVFVRLELGRVLAAAGRRSQAMQVFDGIPRPAAVSGAALLGHGYLSLGEYEKSAGVVEEFLRGKPQLAAPALLAILSAAQFHLGRYSEAVESATASIARGGAAAVSVVSAYRWRARSLDRLGRHEEAARDIAELIRMGRTVLDHLAPDDEWKRGFTDARRGFSDDAIAVLWRAGKHTEALRAAEVFRARAFLDLLASRNASDSGQQESLPVAEPEQPRLRSHALAAEVTAEQLSGYAAAANTTLLSYYAHPDGVYMWVLRGDGGIHHAFSPLAANRLEQLVGRARQLKYHADHEAWRALYRHLIQPVRQWLPAGPGAPDLSILPHGALLEIPFGALLSAGGRYLLEDFSIRVAPAAPFLQPAAAKAAGPVLLLGAPAGLAKGLPPIEGTRRELEKVARVAGAAHTMLRGADATEARLEESAAGAGVLHIATHAVVDGDRPFQSYLALANAGRLTAGRIYRFRLNADLVMLTACQAGSGKRSADGLLGFPRAFLYAGAASVVAPLWDLPDGPLLELVERFYRLYRGGAGKSQALRSAQLRLLADLRAGRIVATTPAGPMPLPEHPGLWAGLVLQGAN